MMRPNITILYGSETGTAQDIAEQIWKRSKRYGLKSTVDAMDDYNIGRLENDNVLLAVVSTAGQGDMPMNMKNFWRFLLRKSLPNNLLSHLKYSVLGLGDSSFEKFNFAAKKLNKRLGQLGATEIVPIGLADDQHDLGIDAVFGTWLDGVFNEIAQRYGIPKENIIGENEIIQKFNINILENEKILTDTKKDIYLYEAQTNKLLIPSQVIENIRTTTPNHFQDVRLIKFKVPEINYSPGDVLYIKAKNSDEQVNKFFKVLKNNGVDIDQDVVLHIEEKEIKVPLVLQQKLSLKQIAQQYWDLNVKPKRSALHTLSMISENELEKEKLLEFTTAEGQEELYNYINRPRRNIIEVLNDFPHTTAKLNLKLLFEIMTPIKPRAYSIASSLKHTKNELHLLVAVTTYKTKLVEPRFGLCSTWLATLKPEDEVVFWTVKGTFKFDYTKPMIIVGPGTGISPFRSLLLDKAAVDGDLSSCLLFFGCRNEKHDYHCKEDFEILVEKHKLKLFCAFSRDQPDKIYVQHIIKQQKQLCWDFLQKDGNIYLAGAEPVRLSPGWEGTGKTDDELNFKNVTMDQANLELNPPRDRLNIVMFIMILHGVGALMPWNMFISAPSYFQEHKLSPKSTGDNSTQMYVDYFSNAVTFSAQVPNVVFNWLNLFLPLAGNLTTRIVYGIFAQVVVFVFTIVLAMIDSSSWANIFFWITMGSVVILNISNGIYQNSVFGMAAKLPGKYTGCVVLGSNISGTFTSVMILLTTYFSPSPRTSAIYYFITALFVLLACFDTYFALPINRFYRYHEYLHEKEASQRKTNQLTTGRPPLWEVFKQCALQCFNVWFIFFVTLSVFPSVMMKVQSPNYEVDSREANYFTLLFCFLNFNVTAMIGSFLASMYKWPSKKYLIVPVLLRVVFIPLFLVCRYMPNNRTFIFIENDWAFLFIGALMGLSSGYFSSCAMTYCSTTVEPRYASTAGMFGAAFLVTGVFSGILFSFAMPVIAGLLG
ncbi:NADPH-dependent diflavin oxidoreductase 1-like isoform X3 [Trichogramma pretiosum]|uniref:NADPH-dependent diflavin oxidoreductase 1-like isoform X3 n=1 Tax=Trichogramma pretiosum TaxID=7493 RepID=UPI000C71A743|nr:NADPH-dependent diflavin oxidoreductase 1-like isoform X3 [Trichogramma pretiosum]